MGLALTRTADDTKDNPLSVIILETMDGEIEVKLTKVKGKRGTLVFDAPDSVRILRKEMIRGDQGRQGKETV